MYKHHEDTIKNITEKLSKNEDVLAIMIGGSIAHGFETEYSDVDIMIIIPNELYKEKYNNNAITYWENESCTYEGGYIDGKFMTLDFLQEVALRGNEATRFSFEGAIITFSKVEGLSGLINKIIRYPVEDKQNKIMHFYYQLMTWRYFCAEGINKNDKYILNLSISNIILFGCRLILAHNETLFPFHKWLLKTVSKVQNKPDNLMDYIDAVLNNPSMENVNNYCNCIFDFTDWGITPSGWTDYDMKYEEQNWMNGNINYAGL